VTQSSESSYENTIKTLLHTQRGTYQDLSYLPTFRASGLFFVVIDEQTATHVSFMNYWREKNNNSSVGAMVTLRDAEGTKVGRRYFRVDEMVYQIDARDILETSGPFLGSLEVDFYSDEDLKYAFPALSVFYETPGGLSYVHTNQRVFNNLDDQERGVRFNAWQTGFDIRFDDGTRPFIFLVNGPRHLSDATVELKVFNATGELIERKISLGELPGYAARRLELAEIDGLRGFLGTATGFCKINAPFGDVYCRFACGNSLADGSWMSVTHSYFDCTAHDDFYTADAFADNEMPCYVPFHLIDGLDVELVFYPIMAKTKVAFSIECFDEEGRRRAIIEAPEAFDTAGERVFRIDVRKWLAEHGVTAGETLYCVHVDPTDGLLPTRVSFGLNYRKGQRLGTNISSSVLMATSHGIRARSWLWGSTAHRVGATNVIMVSHLSKLRDSRESAEFTLLLYGRHGQVASKTYKSINGTAINIMPGALLKDAGYTPQDREVLWYALQSDNSSLICNQLHISSEGNIGGDHSF
jgi:hypothetical protein